MGKAELIWASRYYFKLGNKMEPHEHDYFQIYYFLEGHGEIYINQTCYHFSRQELYLVLPFQKHRISVGEKSLTKIYDIKFLIHDPDLLKQVQTVAIPITLPDKELMALFNKVAGAGLTKEFFDHLLVFMLEYPKRTGAVIGQKTITDGDKAGPAGLAALVVDYLKKNYQEKITLEKLAAALGYNSCYICQIFKKQMKCSPMHYLYRFRIDRAKEMISELNYNLEQVAQMSGFESIHHLSKVFKKYEGITLSRWRTEDSARKMI